MQIANGTVILSPENQQFKYGFTPAEAMILYEMHRVYSNGTPLGDCYIQDGEALTIDSEGRPAEDEDYNPLSGKTRPPRPAVPAVTHKRTQAEEIQRLKKFYTGNITKNGVTSSAFIATFGQGVGIHLPETFAEIEEAIGVVFKKQPAASPEEKKLVSRKTELLGKLRADLCEVAVGLKLKVHAQDTKEAIVDAIIAAESTKPQAA
jgi:hypothetical protein